MISQGCIGNSRKPKFPFHNVNRMCGFGLPNAARERPQLAKPEALLQSLRIIIGSGHRNCSTPLDKRHLCSYIVSLFFDIVHAAILWKFCGKCVRPKLQSLHIWESHGKLPREEKTALLPV